MPTLRVVTPIDAPRERVFDLARSIDLHRLSTAGTEEEAIARRTSGLIGYGEEVTWRARHFSLRQTLTARITAYNRPYKFTYPFPLGPLGRLAERLVLDRYLTRLLKDRNAVIQSFAESDRWRELPGMG